MNWCWSWSCVWVGASMVQVVELFVVGCRWSRCRWWEDGGGVAESEIWNSTSVRLRKLQRHRWTRGGAAFKWKRRERGLEPLRSTATVWARVKSGSEWCTVIKKIGTEWCTVICYFIYFLKNNWIRKLSLLDTKLKFYRSISYFSKHIHLFSIKLNVDKYITLFKIYKECLLRRVELSW